MTDPLPTPAEMLRSALRNAREAAETADEFQLAAARLCLDVARELREGAAERRRLPAWASGDRAEFPVTFEAGITGHEECGIYAYPIPTHICRVKYQDVRPAYGDQAHDQTVILHAHTEQPMPTPNGGASIQALVRRDLEDREQVGIQRYGTPLQANNGRNATRDAYEEALDLACYLRQMLEEGR